MSQIRYYLGLLLLSILCYNCVEDANINPMQETKYLLIGYVPIESESPAVVNIVQSAVINNNFSQYPVLDVPLELVALSNDSDTTRFGFYYNSDDGNYHSVETGIGKINYSYWIEFTIENTHYKSEPIQVSREMPEIVKRKKVDDPRFISVQILDQFQSMSYFIDFQISDIWNVFTSSSARSGQFHDARRYTGNPYGNYLPSKDLWLYIVQIPKPVEAFIGDWVLQNENNFDDALSQLFAVTPANTKGNIKRVDEQFQETVSGIFFPCNLFKEQL